MIPELKWSDTQTQYDLYRGELVSNLQGEIKVNLSVTTAHKQTTTAVCNYFSNSIMALK